jgi:hypothetical protein
MHFIDMAKAYLKYIVSICLSITLPKKTKTALHIYSFIDKKLKAFTNISVKMLNLRFRKD